MTEKRKALVVGCGSIGRRHIKNLRSLGVEDFILCDTEKSRLVGASVGFIRPTLTTDFNEAVEVAKANKVDAAVICTPSNLHLPMATRLAGEGINLLIEKPLSHTLEGADELAGRVAEKGVTAMMAMCYRFHPVLLKVKEILDSGTLGRVYHANYFGGHYLPDWHPEADYRREYAARRELGGGVVLTSIHGLDNVRFLFGDIETLGGVTDRVSPLEMDVEDFSLALIRTAGGVYVSWQTDFLNRAPTHRLEVTCAGGSLRADFISGSVEWFTPDEGWRREDVEFDANDMYVRELEHFLHCVETGSAPGPSLEEGMKTLSAAVELKACGRDEKGGKKLCVA